MLSSVLLRFTDNSAKRNYNRDRSIYFGKLLPVITFAFTALLIVIEIVYRGAKLGSLKYKTSIINAAAVVAFIGLTVINKKNHVFATWLVCPALTAFIFYYADFVDYDGSDLSILYKMVLAITLSFFLLVFFSE
jgi:hypothetical protein